MKKILTFAAVALVAVAVEATTIGWNVGGLSSVAGNAYQMFIVGQNGVKSVSQITDMLTSGDDISSYAVGSGTVASNGSIRMAPASSGINLPSVDGGYQIFGFVYDKAKVGDATKYAALPSYTMTFGSQAANYTAPYGDQSAAVAADKWQDVPEPTSLALIALGVAAFGLKRKHA